MPHDGNLEKARQHLKKSLSVSDVNESAYEAAHAIAFALIAQVEVFHLFLEMMEGSKIEISPPEP